MNFLHLVLLFFAGAPAVLTLLLVLVDPKEWRTYLSFGGLLTLLLIGAAYLANGVAK